MKWFRSALIALLVVSWSASTQETVKLNDWRLTSPYKHGLLVSLSLGTIQSDLSELKVNQPGEYFGFPIGTLPYLAEHRKIPFSLGLITGGLLYLSLILGLYGRFRNAKGTV